MDNNKPPIDIRGMAPLLQVFDMPVSLHFYRDILGFTLKGKSDDGEGDKVYWTWLNFGGTEIMLNEMYERDCRPAQPDTQRNAAHHDTSLYFGCPNVDETYKYLIANNIELKPPVTTQYNFKAIYVKDPDGYQLVFHWPVE